ncbi:MAG: hypothetical protein JWO57_125 [Pseudonocardiales bacterium]|nr:hypothetical protein [Pseudonocardiales bacterium]
MPFLEISDAAIAELSPHERQELIMRLARPTSELVGSATAVRKLRRHRLTFLIVCAAALVPWTVYLGLSLPDRYVARNWSVTWVGFDAVLVAMFLVTALLGALRRQMLVLTTFASGILLLCDAWFDLTTAGPDDIWVSVATAGFVEVPIAVLLISSALRLVHLMAARLWLLEPGMRLWQLPLPLADLFGDSRKPPVAAGTVQS